MTLGELKEVIDGLLRAHPAGTDLPVQVVPGYEDWRDIVSVTREGDQILIDIDVDDEQHDDGNDDNEWDDEELR